MFCHQYDDSFAGLRYMEFMQRMVMLMTNDWQKCWPKYFDDGWLDWLARQRSISTIMMISSGGWLIFSKVCPSRGFPVLHQVLRKCLCQQLRRVRKNHRHRLKGQNRTKLNCYFNRPIGILKIFLKQYHPQETFLVKKWLGQTSFIK